MRVCVYVCVCKCVSVCLCIWDRGKLDNWPLGTTPAQTVARSTIGLPGRWWTGRLEVYLVGLLAVWLALWLIGCLSGRTLPGNDDGASKRKESWFGSQGFFLVFRYETHLSFQIWIEAHRNTTACFFTLINSDLRLRKCRLQCYKRQRMMLALFLDKSQFSCQKTFVMCCRVTICNGWSTVIYQATRSSRDT